MVLRWHEVSSVDGGLCGSGYLTKVITGGAEYYVLDEEMTDGAVTRNFAP